MIPYFRRDPTEPEPFNSREREKDFLVQTIFQTVPSLASLHLPHHHYLFSDYISTTHLQKPTIYRQNHCKFATHAPPRTSIASNAYPLDSNCLIASLAPLEAILFDIDGTLCDSEPHHYNAFREMLQEVGFNGGVPITEEFFINKISGKHNEELCGVLFPDWNLQRARKFLDDKEAMFRRCCPNFSQGLVSIITHTETYPKLNMLKWNFMHDSKPVNGLHKLCKWIEDRGLKRAAVTNAPRSNAELLISSLGLSDFFEILVLATECRKPKPSPDAYMKALQVLEVSHKHAFVFEDSVSGVKAGVGAGMPVVGVALRNPEKLISEAGAIFCIKDFDDPKLWTALEELERKDEVTTVTA